MLLPYTLILNPESISIGMIIGQSFILKFPGSVTKALNSVTDSGKVLGSGEYGVVCQGTCNEQPVAVKAIKGAVNVEEFKAVLAEVKIMAYLGDHENIVKFVGAEVSKIAQRNPPSIFKPVYGLESYI